MTISNLGFCESFIRYITLKMNWVSVEDNLKFRMYPVFGIPDESLYGERPSEYGQSV